MTINIEDLLNSIIESIGRIDYVRPADIPNIDLYMDQVTTFMDEHFQATKRYPEDKVLTKTMINNYAKNNLLPPPVKKKYNKDHVMLLILIYYFKSILSIKDIDTLLDPITTKYFGGINEVELKDIYEEICEAEKDRVEFTQKDIAKIYQNAQKLFEDVPEEDQEYLRTFAFICGLSFDVYVKKQLIENLIDELPQPSKKRK